MFCFHYKGYVYTCFLVNQHTIVQSTQPKPELLNEVLRNLLRPDLIIYRSLASPQINILRVVPLGPLEDLPECKCQEEERYTNVCRDEILLLR